MAKELKELTPRSVNYSQWYQDLVIKADLAENSAVRGCMVIKPYGYAMLKIKLATDFGKLSNVRVVARTGQEEQKKLENKVMKE